MMTNKITPLPGVRIDLDNIAGDHLAIKQCARFVDKQMTEMGAAERYLACGEELFKLRDTLRRPSPRGSNERIGWLKAFKLEPHEFPFTRQYADQLIKIYEFFNATTVALKKLPASINALKEIIAFDFPQRDIMRCINDGRISPGTTEKDVRKVAKELGLEKKKAKPRAEKPEPTATEKLTKARSKYTDAARFLTRQEKIQELWRTVEKLGLTAKDLQEIVRQGEPK